MGAYEEAIAYLQALEVVKGWDLKLDRMRTAVARRGTPHRRFLSLHVAGTNGKGSTAAMIEAVLHAAGHRTGLYTSPHLVDFCERIRAGGRTIPRDDVAALVAELRTELTAGGLALTHFEFTTLLAFEWFARIGCEVVVVEVGLGGRLDATNVVRPRAAAITSIGRDHEEWLGSDLASIAREKAGIAKVGVPLIVGRMPQQAYAAVAEEASAAGAPLVRAGTLEESQGFLRFRGPCGVVWDELRLGLPGAHQRTNAEVALSMLAVVQRELPCTREAVQRGLARVEWPGRLTVLDGVPRVVLDGAHNPDGAAAFARALPAVVGDRPVVLVLAVMVDKRWDEMLDALVPLAARVVATLIGRRGLAPAALAASLAGRVPVEVIDDPAAAIRRARASCRGEETLVVTGSLFLVGEAYRVLGGARVPALFPPWHGWGGDGTETPP